MAKLHQEGDDVTAADGYWLVALSLEPFIAILVISFRPSYTKKETMRQQRMELGL